MIVDAFNVTSFILTYQTVARALSEAGMLNEVHEARLWTHIKVPQHMLNDLGGRIVAKLVEKPELQRRITELVPGTVFRFAPQRIMTVSSRTAEGCAVVTAEEAQGFDLVCVDRNERKLTLTLMRY